jgi:hypothetical protein
MLSIIFEKNFPYTCPKGTLTVKRELASRAMVIKHRIIIGMHGNDKNEPGDAKQHDKGAYAMVTRSVTGAGQALRCGPYRPC